MSAFIAIDADPVVTAEDQSAGSIAGDGFWPAVDLDRVRAIGRIPTMVTIDQLREATIGAVIAVTRQLIAWRQSHLDAGRATLAAIDPTLIAGTLRLEHLYLRAVTATVAADLLDTRQEIGATRDGRDRADVEEVPSPDWRRMATHAIRDIAGKPRTRARLL